MSELILSSGPANRAPEDSALFLVSPEEGVFWLDVQRASPLFAREDLPGDGAPALTSFFLATYQNRPVYLIQTAQSPKPSITITPIRRILKTAHAELQTLLFRAAHLTHWDKATQFCGYCGNKTTPSQKEFTKHCTHCSTLHYPHYAPSIIVCIYRPGEILLGRSALFEAGVYSTLAGFIEAGETAEAAVHREINEEVGLSVQTVAFFGTQPWPFPRSFMLGYTAQYLSGDIHIDPNELEDARWFSITKLPTLPNSASIAYRLIQKGIQLAG